MPKALDIYRVFELVLESFRRAFPAPPETSIPSGVEDSRSQSGSPFCGIHNRHGKERPLPRDSSMEILNANWSVPHTDQSFTTRIVVSIK